MSVEMNNQDLEARAAAALERAKIQPAEGVDNSALVSRVPVSDPVQKIERNEIPHTSQIPKEMVTPQVPIPEKNSFYAPPPSAEEMAANGAVTADQVAPVAIPVDDDEEAIFSGSNVHTAPVTEDDETVIITSAGKEQLKGMPDSEQNAFLEGILPEITQYKKELILNYGMTPAEATTAAQNRMKNKAIEAKKSWDEAHPDGVIVTIDKTQEEQLSLSEDDRRKMQVAKALKLVVVESQELETLKVKPANSVITMSNIRDICGSLSQYSVPLLEFGDYATFSGAQTGALANATANDDDDFVDIIEKKATLLYQYFQKGTLMSRKVDRTDEKGKITKDDMSYEEFCNWYRYDDMDMGIYAIVTASAMEVSESTYTCQNKECGKTFNISYNNKTLLDLSHIPDEYKTRLNEIDEARSSLERMHILHDKYAQNMRVKSPFSKNVYEMGSPSIADARHRLDVCMEQLNGSNLIDMILLLYIDTLYVFDQNAGDYAAISVRDDPQTGFEAICRLHQIDLELLYKYIQEHKYNATFKIKTKCPHCGREATDLLNADGMIFLHARASLTEIQ